MDENLQNLEREVEEQLAARFAESTLPIPGEVLSRTKMVVRHALDEQWFAEQEQTSAPVQAVAQVKSAVRRELTRREDDAVPKRPYAVRFVSFMSAAAVIVLFIGIVQYTNSLSNKPTLSKDTLAEPLDLFVMAAESASEENLLTTIASDLDAIEESITQWPHESGDWGLDEFDSEPNKDSHDQSRDSTS